MATADAPTVTRPVKLLVAGLTAITFLFVIALVLAAGTDGRAGLGEPAGSRLRVVEDVFPIRTLSTADIRRAGRNCLEGRSLVLRPRTGCMIIVPDGVRWVALRRVAGSPGMTITLSRTSDVTQVVDTSQPGPDRREPDRLRLAVPHDGTTITLSGCSGAAPCRVDLEQ